MKIVVRVLIFTAAMALWSGALSCKVPRGENTEAVPVPSPSSAFSEAVEPDPKGTKPTFHETIDKATGSVGKRSLRETILPENDLEVRVWAGFGLTSLKGFILQRNHNNWSASAIGGDFDIPQTTKYKETILAAPAIGWEAAWQRLLEHKLLILPNAETIKCSAMYTDGYSYVVEIKKGNQYRTYMYDNPWAKFENRCLEADEILEIASIIMSDYGVAGFRWDD